MTKSYITIRTSTLAAVWLPVWFISRLRYKNIGAIASDNDERRQIKARLDAVRASGDRRLLVTISDNWRAELNRLEENHQNFSGVIDYIRAAYATAELHDRVARPGNILLDGPPGCGKTYFAKKLAECMGVKFRSISMESMQAGFELLGTSAIKWLQAVLSTAGTGLKSSRKR